MNRNKKGIGGTSSPNPSFSFGKRGIMLKFLMTILLAILIFAPAIMFTMKFCRLSEQAGESFEKFVKEINDFSEGEEPKDFMLIIDKETAIVGFTKEKFQNCHVRGSGEECETWDRPNVPECNLGSCICLFDELVKRGEKTRPKLVVEYKSANCIKIEDIEFALQKTKAGLKGDYMEDIFDVHQKDGFLIGRNIRNPVLHVEPLEFEGRRNIIYLINKEERVFICLDPECSELDLTSKIKPKGIVES